MTRYKKIFVIVIASLVVLCLYRYCGIRIQIMDSITNSPIQNAIYKTARIVGSSPITYGSEKADYYKSDARGVAGKLPIINLHSGVRRYVYADGYYFKALSSEDIPRVNLTPHGYAVDNYLGYRHATDLYKHPKTGELQKLIDEDGNIAESIIIELVPGEYFELTPNKSDLIQGKKYTEYKPQARMRIRPLTGRLWFHGNDSNKDTNPYYDRLFYKVNEVSLDRHESELDFRHGVYTYYSDANNLYFKMHIWYYVQNQTYASGSWINIQSAYVRSATPQVFTSGPLGYLRAHFKDLYARVHPERIRTSKSEY